MALTRSSSNSQSRVLFDDLRDVARLLHAEPIGGARDLAAGGTRDPGGSDGER
jgi:hypothetical protein